MSKAKSSNNKETIQKFNDAYSYVSSKISSLLQEDGNPTASDNKNFGKGVEHATVLMHMLQQSVRAYLSLGNTEELIKLQETIIDYEYKRKKNLI